MVKIMSTPCRALELDSYWGWLVVFGAFMIRFIYDGFMYTFGVFHVALLEYFETSNGATSIVWSLLVGITSAAGPFASCLISNCGCRNVSFFGSLLAVLGLLLSLIVPKIEYLYFTIGMLTGFGFGMMDLVTVVSVGEHFEEQRATAMGLAFSGAGLGALALAPLFEWLSVYYGLWKGAILIATGLILNCALLSLCYCDFGPEVQPSPSMEVLSIRSLESVDQEAEMPTYGSQAAPLQTEVTTDVGENVTPEVDNLKATETQHIASKHMYGSVAMHGTSTSVAQQRGVGCADMLKELVDMNVLTDHKFLIFTLSNLTLNMGIKAPFIYVTHRAKNLGVATETTASYLLSIMGISNTLGRLACGAFLDRTSMSTSHVFITILIINGVSTAMTSMITEYYQMAFYCVLFGSTFGAHICLTPVLLVELLGIDKLNQSYGLCQFAVGIATAFGVPLTGLLYDVTGSYDEGFYFCATLILSAALLLFLIPIMQNK